jgi:hypothetical protein
MCAGGALCVFSSFGLMVCALCLSIVLSQMCRGVALAKWVGDLSSSGVFLFAFVWLSIACWSFFLFVSFHFIFSQVTICVCVVNALITGEIENHLWFGDRWMIASWCDE